MKNRWKRIPAIILSFIIVFQSIYLEGIHFVNTTYADEEQPEAISSSDSNISTEETPELGELTQSEALLKSSVNSRNEISVPSGSPLVVEGGVYNSSLYLNQDTYLTEDVVIEGDLRLYYFTLQLNGHHMIIHGDLYMYGETTCLIVDGILETYGRVEARDSSIEIRDGQWNCREDLILKYNMKGIRMTSNQAVLQLDRDMIIMSDFHGDLEFENGTLMLGGDYIEMPTNRGSFQGAGIHAGEGFQVCLTGEGSQMLAIESEDTMITHVSIPEGETRSLYLPKCNPIPEDGLENLILYPHIYRITQEHYDYNCSNNVSNYYYDNVYFEGDILKLNQITIYGSFYHRGNVTITGIAAIHGDYGVESLQYDGTDLVHESTEGKLSIQSYVTVDGNFTTRSTVDHEMTDWKGQLTIGGSLYQYGLGVANFNPDSSFLCILNGDDSHIYFEDSEHNWMPIVIRASSKPVILDSQVQFTNSTSGAFEGKAYVKEENLNKIGNAAALSLYMNELILDQDVIFPLLSLHMSGQLNLNGHNLICNDLILEDGSNASILMTRGEELTINNNLYVASQSNESRLSNGSIHLYGNLTQKNTGATDNFSTTDRCVIHMVGDGRGQFVSFDEGAASIETMKIHNQGGGYVHFLTEVPVKHLICETDTLTAQDQRKIMGYQMTEDVTYSDTMILKGGTLDLNGHVLTVEGDLIIESGNLYINQGELIVHGDLRYQTMKENGETITYQVSYGSLQMENKEDHIHIDGSAYFDTAGSQNKITDGILEIAGNLIFFNPHFCPSNHNKIVLCGIGEQKITVLNGTCYVEQLDIQCSSLSIEGGFGVNHGVEDHGCAKTGVLYTKSLSDICDGYLGDVILTGAETLTGNVNVQGIISLNTNLNAGEYTVQADAIIIGAILNIGAGRVECNNLIVNGSIIMQDLNAELITNQMVLNTSRVSNITNGTLRIHNSITEEEASQGLRTTGQSNVVLDAEAVTEEHSIPIHIIEKNTHFQNLELRISWNYYDCNITVFKLAENINLTYEDPLAPTIPENFQAYKVSYWTVYLSYGASEDNENMVEGYIIYRDGEEIAKTERTLWVDQTVNHKTSYEYQVAAYDKHGNISEKTDVLVITTLGDTVAPKPVSSASIDAYSETELELSWYYYADYLERIQEYHIFRDHEMVAVIPYKNEYNYLYTYRDNTVLTDVPYEYGIQVIDQAGNASEIKTVTAIATQMPDEITKYTVKEDDGDVMLTWEDFSQQAGLYKIYRSSHETTGYYLIGSVPKNDTNIYSYIDSTNEVNSRYYYRVDSYITEEQLGRAGIGQYVYAYGDTKKPIITRLAVDYEKDGILNKNSFIYVSAEDTRKMESIQIQYQKKGDNTWQNIKYLHPTYNEDHTTLNVWCSFNTDYLRGTYVIRVTATDIAGNTTTETKELQIYTTGYSAPIITNIKVRDTSIELQWESTDTTISSYMIRIFEDGVMKTRERAADSNYGKVTALKPGHTYECDVIPYNARINEYGIPSDLQEFTTLTDITPPVIRQVTPAPTDIGDSLSLSIDAVDDDAIDYITIEMSRDMENWVSIDKLTPRLTDKTPYSSYINTSTYEEGELYIRIQAADLASNLSDYTIHQYIIDHTPPSRVMDLTSYEVDGGIGLRWTVEEGCQYLVKRKNSIGNYQWIADRYDGIYEDEDISYGVDYEYCVVGRDTAGNESVISNEVTATMMTDTVAPEITKFTVKYYQNQAEIYAEVKDNAQLSNVIVAIYINREWKNIIEYNCSRKKYWISREYDCSDYEEGTYLLKAVVSDMEDHIVQKTVSMTVDHTAPDIQSMSVTDMGNTLHIQWDPYTKKDYSYYKLIRIGEDNTEKVLSTITDSTVTDTYDVPEIGKRYLYQLKVVDIYGNEQILERVGRRVKADQEAPVVKITCDGEEVTKVTAGTGQLLMLSGEESTDNVGIESMKWYIDDVFVQESAHLQYYFDTKGTYRIRLEAVDNNQNQSDKTVTVKVADEITGTISENDTVLLQVVDEKQTLFSYVDIYYTNDPESGEYEHTQTDLDGRVELHLDVGEYRIIAYKDSYLPQEITIHTDGKEAVYKVITMQRQSIASGTITVTEMTIQEILDAGIDLNEEDNRSQVKTEIEIHYAKVEDRGNQEIRKETITLYNNKPTTKTYSSSGVTHQTTYQRIDTGIADLKNEPLIIIIDTQSISWLKEMFRVDVEIWNMAGESFNLSQCELDLNLPTGMSLVNCNEDNTLHRSIGTIAAGEAKTVTWYVKGDEKGSYPISADFQAVLEPIGKLVTGTFRTDKNVEVTEGEGLVLYVYPERTSRIGNQLYIQYKLVNEGTRTFYDVKTTFGEYQSAARSIKVKDRDADSDSNTEEAGHILETINFFIKDVKAAQSIPVLQGGDTVTLTALHPDEAIYGTYLTEFGNTWTEDGKKYTDIGALYEIVESKAKILEGYNTGIKVEIVPIKAHKTFEWYYGDHTYDLPDPWQHTTPPDPIPEPVVTPVPEPHFFQGDPVSLSTGAYQAEINAITLQGIEPLTFKMFYDSMYTSEHSDLGYGWNHNYEWRLEDHGSVLELYQNPYQSLTFIRENAANGIVYGSIQDNDITVESVEGDVKYVCLDASAAAIVLLAHETGGYTLTQADGTVYEFDAEGRLIRTISRSGNIVNISREEHSMKLTEQGSGCYILLRYDDAGLVTEVSDSSGRSIHLAYDDQKQLMTYTDVNGSGFGFAYDEHHRILTGTDPEGQVYLVNTYDEEGRVLAQDDGDAETALITFDYSTTDDGYLLIKSKNKNGKYLSTKSDNSGNILSQVNELGDTITCTYDDAGRLLSKTMAGLTESYTYSDEGYLTSSTDALGNQTSYQYDDRGNCIRITTNTGTTSFEYNDKNYLITETDAQGITTTYTYNDYGLVTEEKVEGRGKTSYTYQGYQMTGIKDILGNTTATTYDAVGRLTDVTDAMGNQTHVTYDARGAVTSIARMDADSGKTIQCSYIYDSVGNLISYTDGNGYTTTYEYDINDQLLAENYADGTRTECVRDGEGNILSILYSDTVQGSSMEEAVYDAVGNLTELKNVYGYTTSYQYGSLGRLESVLQPNGDKITYTYDGHGLLTGQTDARGNTTTFSYDSAGRLIGIIDTLGVICRIEYDSYGQIVSIEDGTGSRTTLTYDTYGQVIRSGDAAGNLTTYEYDIAGNRIRQTNALGAVTEYEYDSAGQVVTVRKLGKKKDKLETNYTYDAFGNIISITNGEGNTYQITYDKNGNPTEYYDAYGRLMQNMRYDCRNRLMETVSADGKVQTSTYDAMGNLLSSVTRNSSGTASVLYQYGSNGMLSQVTDQAGNTSSITYDEMGNIVDYTNPNGGVTSYTYDKNNNILREQVGDDFHLVYTYDERNQRIRKENARGQRTVYEYDLAGRLISQKDDLGTITYTYDTVGNLTEVADASGTIRREYDAIGQMTAYTDADGNRLTYDYDLYGNVVKLHYADGRTVSYGYDKTGHMTSATDWAGRITNYTYNKNGQLTETKRADGSLEIRTYNDAGQLLSISDTVNGSMIHQYTYQYDGNGNITHIRTEGDEAAAGDVSLIPECVMEYDAVNRLTKYNGETVRYDADGNMIYGPLNGVMTDFTYDCRNRLIQAGNTTYTYDAENNRIGMKTPKRQVQYIVDSQQELTRILQANETNAKTKEQKVTYYIYGRGLIAQEQITVEDGFESTVEVHTGLFGRTKHKTGIYRIYHFDHLGSTTAVTNEEGTVVNSYDYSPYGQILAGKEDAYLFLYNGQYGVTTDGNGLYYMRARYYNVSIMRFINQDVVHGYLSDSQSLNRFAYVEGNPINFLDPFGLEKWRSEFYLEHELFDEWGNTLMGCNAIAALLGFGIPAISEFTEEFIAIASGVATTFSLVDAVLYFIDIINATQYGTVDDIAYSIRQFRHSTYESLISSFAISKYYKLLFSGRYSDISKMFDMGTLINNKVEDEIGLFDYLDMKVGGGLKYVYMCTN